MSGRRPRCNSLKRASMQGKALHALHLAEAVLVANPADVDALWVELEATQYLLERSGRENFSEVRWLEGEIRALRSASDRGGP
jgi:hypothetical protein